MLATDAIGAEVHGVLARAQDVCSRALVGRAAEAELSALSADASAASERIAALKLALEGELAALNAALNLARGALGVEHPQEHHTPGQASGDRRHIAPVTADELETVSASWRGRLQLARLNAWIDAFNALLDERSALLRAVSAGGSRALSVEARQRVADLRAAECDEAGGRPFLTEHDLRCGRPVGANSKVTPGGGSVAPAVFKLDQTGKTIVAVLRHLGRLREVRSSGVLRYVVL